MRPLSPRKSLLLTALALAASALIPLRAAPSTRQAEFDALVEPAVRQAVRKPVTPEGGSLAWGESYLLAALAEMLET